MSEAHGAEVWEGEQSQQLGGQVREEHLVLEGEQPEVWGSVTDRRGGTRSLRKSDLERIFLIVEVNFCLIPTL